MPDMTFAEVKAEIAARINRDDLTDRIDKTCKDRIGFYRKELLYSAEDTDSSITTVAGTTFYDLPDGVFEVEFVRLNLNGLWIDLTRAQDYRERLLSDVLVASLQALPAVWGIFGTQIWLYPTPNAAYPLELTCGLGVAVPSGDGVTNFWTKESGGQSLIINSTCAEIFRTYITNPVRKGEYEEAEIREYDQLVDKGFMLKGPIIIDQH